MLCFGNHDQRQSIPKQMLKWRGQEPFACYLSSSLDSQQFWPPGYIQSFPSVFRTCSGRKAQHWTLLTGDNGFLFQYFLPLVKHIIIPVAYIPWRNIMSITDISVKYIELCEEERCFINYKVLERRHVVRCWLEIRGTYLIRRKMQTLDKKWFLS